jgi:hypothetical protein
MPRRLKACGGMDMPSEPGRSAPVGDPASTGRPDRIREGMLDQGPPSRMRSHEDGSVMPGPPNRGERLESSFQSRQKPSTRDSAPSPRRLHPPVTDTHRRGVDPDQLARVHRSLIEREASNLWLRHLRGFRRAKSIRRFVRSHEPDFAAAGLSAESRAELIVSASALVGEVETDDWARVSARAAAIANTVPTRSVKLRTPEA